MALSATGVSKAKAIDKPQKLADGGGMYLLIQPTGAKLWRMDYRFDGKRKTLALGIFPDVSLSDQAVSVLRELYPLTGHGEYVFPNRNGIGRVISENTVNKIIEAMGYKGRQTGHGFRGLARTTLGEMGHRREVLEAMLSHAIENETETAYVRTTYLDERRIIMQKWADYLDSVKAGAQVIPFGKAA